jgi:prepilin-type N-terminal cleavage/methylation domain-containing protein
MLIDMGIPFFVPGRTGGGGLVKERGFSLIELLVTVATFGVLAALAIPGLLRARISANESSAIASIRAVSSAQGSYASAAADGGYATTLARLATPCPGGTAGFISPDLATDPSAKAGFHIEVQPAAAGRPAGVDCNGTPTETDFYATAVPVMPGVSGNRAFASSAAATIYYDPSGVAPTRAAIAPGGGALVLP